MSDQPTCRTCGESVPAGQFNPYSQQCADCDLKAWTTKRPAPGKGQERLFEEGKR